MTPADTVTEYFRGERGEMIAILTAATAVVVVAAAFWWRQRDGFATGFAVTVVLAALLLGGTAAGLLMRDGRTAPRLVAEVSAPATATAAVTAENDRVDRIIRTYPLYRYGAAALAALAVGCLLLIAGGWTHGIAAALLLVVAAQVTIDQYSEARARLYAARLSGAAG